MLKILVRGIGALGFLFIPNLLQANEVTSSRIGTFDFEGFRLQGGMGGAGYSRSEISLVNSYLGISWQLAPHFKGYFELGDLQFQRGLIWTGSPDSLDFGLRRASLEYQSQSIGIKFGLIGNAFNSGVDIFPASILVPTQAYEFNIWKKQVTGIELFWSHHAWKSQFQVFRPDESSPSAVSSPWVSGAFSYSPRNAVGVIIAAQSGQLEKEQLHTEGLNRIGLNSVAPSPMKVRMGRLGLFRNSNDSQYLLEWSKGELNQQIQNLSFAWTVLDIRQRLFQGYQLYIRMDRWAPDVNQTNLDMTRSDLGVTINDGLGKWIFFLRENSSSFASAIKKNQEGWIYYTLTSY